MSLLYAGRRWGGKGDTGTGIVNKVIPHFRKSRISDRRERAYAQLVFSPILFGVCVWLSGGFLCSFYWFGYVQLQCDGLRKDEIFVLA